MGYETLKVFGLISGGTIAGNAGEYNRPGILSIERDRAYEQGLPQVSCETSKIQQVFFNILKIVPKPDPSANSS